MHDSFRLEIEGKSVFLKADGAILHETTLGEFINQIVLLSDRSILDDPLPDGVRFIKRRGDRATLVVVEVRPQYRMVKWIDDKSPEPYGPDALYQHVRLAFPYIVLFVLFLDGELSGYQQAFYRTEPLLQDLRNRAIGTNEFRKELERVVKDKSALAQLKGELDKIVPTEQQ
jgi:hypothetical protein